MAGALSFAGGLILSAWLQSGTGLAVHARIPRAGDSFDEGGATEPSVRLGDTFHDVLTDRAPTPLPTEWPRFRGPDADNIRRRGPAMTADLADVQARVPWRLELGEGHAGAAVHNGRVYVLDYDEERRADVLRCFDITDGTELWRTGYPVAMKRNHGYSRTVPAVTDQAVATIGPRCHVMVCDTATGRPLWVTDMVAEFATDEPLWYTAQCPLVDGDTLVLAPAGDSVLMTGVDLMTGEARWTVSNAQGWQMSHSSVVICTLLGVRQYVYAAAGGIVSVSAQPGSQGDVLWRTAAWNNRVVAPCPVALDDDRLFLTSGHGAGGLLLRVQRSGDDWSVEEERRFSPDQLASEQQTPILYEDHLFTVLPKDGGAHRMELVSATRQGEILWTSGREHRFGLGPYVIADTKLYVMDDGGRLSIYDLRNPAAPEFRGAADVVPGPEAWAPIAVADGRLILRDNRRMVCLDLRTNTDEQ